MWQEGEVSEHLLGISTGIFLLAGYLLLKSPKDFLQTPGHFLKHLHPQVNVCSGGQAHMLDGGGSRRGESRGLAPGCCLSFWKLVEGVQAQ